MWRKILFKNLSNTGKTKTSFCSEKTLKISCKIDVKCLLNHPKKRKHANQEALKMATKPSPKYTNSLVVKIYRSAKKDKKNV